MNEIEGSVVVRSAFVWTCDKCNYVNKLELSKMEYFSHLRGIESFGRSPMKTLCHNCNELNNVIVTARKFDFL